MKKIRIDIDGDIAQAKGEIKDLIAQIQALPQKLAEDALPIAQSRYAGHNVSVTAQNGILEARGDEVGFAEYGTGIYADYDPEAPIPTGYGTWSASEDGKGFLIKNGFWYYNKQKLTGTMPTNAMRNALEHLKQNGVQIARKNIN